MGTVWHAHDTLLGRDVAVKEIRLLSSADGAADPTDPVLRRALREAQAAARLHHPGIVTVHDVVSDDGRPWIVMELVGGRSLAEAIREHGLLSEWRGARIGLAVIDALRVAHRAGIAHRDVKPANILLDGDRVVLTDFGIAAIHDATALTATGQMVGSPAYLSPERINGQPVTAAADMWALGVTLYATVTGRSPFQREDTQATLAAIMTSRPQTPAHAGRIWPVIKGLLDKDPARRLTAEQARELLAKVPVPDGGEDPAAPAATGRRPGWWPVGQRRRAADPDGPPRTLVAPSPTLAAPTALQDAPPPAPDRSAEPAAAGTATAETAAAETATAETAAAETARAETARAETARAETARAETARAETARAETARAETATAETATAETATAETPAGETMEDKTITAGTAAVPTVDVAPVVLPPFEPAAVVPLAPYPDAPTRTPRARTGWLAALVVGGLLLAGGILRASWPGSGEEADALTSSGLASPAVAGPGSAKPAASATPSAPVNPALDPCLVGTWRMRSEQVMGEIDGVQYRYTSPGGMVMRIWPNGKETDDYSKFVARTVTVKGVKYTDLTRGVETLHVETRNGRYYPSDFSGGKTRTLTRNGRVTRRYSDSSPADNLPYICTETSVTIYGNDKVSTGAFTRLSHTP